MDSSGVGISDVQFGSLAPVVTETGFISWSIDGVGTSAATGNVRVNKPASATVRRAFLGSASTGFSGFKVPNGGVTLDGVGVNWDISTLSSISSWNHWAEVTSLVKSKIDAAPAGTVNFTVGEGNTGAIDGEVLAVIFDDPNQTTVNSAILMFGAQSVGGDTFAIHLSDPLDITNPALKLDLSLGISFGFQPSSQFSIVRVNGTQMTQSAGGQDDGVAANGALLTVGGIGDTNANPPPTAAPTSVRTDDELYSLIPFVHTGDTAISVFSQNPSNDDNIFFAGLFVGDAAAIVGTGIVLGPGNVTLNVGDTETATGNVQDASGHPVPNTAVTFTINAGPNHGLTVTATTDASGNATFSYVGSGGAGIDEITASFVDAAGHTHTSNVALRSWIVPNPPSCALTNVIAGPPKQLEITVQNPIAGISSIEVTDSTNATTVVPVFPQGFKQPVVVTATKTDESSGAHVALSVTDVNGAVTVCDPLLPGESPEIGNDGQGSQDAAGCSIQRVGGGGGLPSVLGLGALLALAFVRRRQSAL
jgi:MYXO-CTERM domain-containing protein